MAIIVGIVGGTLSAAEQIRAWYQQGQTSPSGKTIDKVLLVIEGRRMLLEGVLPAKLP